MEPRSATARRLRWALLIALALHALLLWRYAPQLFQRFEAARSKPETVPARPEEQIVEIEPPAPPPKGRGMVLATTLGGGSPERIASTLPDNFFPKPQPLGDGTLHLADDLGFARKSGAEIVASIIPAATRLPNINALSDRARTPLPKPANRSKPQPAPPLKAPTPVSVAEEDLPPPTRPASSPVPFLLPPEQGDPLDDAAVAEAAQRAERSAREANVPTTASRAPDYRAMLPQGPLVAAPPLPLGRQAPDDDAGVAGKESSGITTFALDAAPAQDRLRAAPDSGKSVAAARQQFFSLLTARLKATNQRLLAEAVRAGPRTTVRMKFLVDRGGEVLEITPAEPASREVLERAAAVIRAADLPPVPAAMTRVPLELSFPVEVYR